MQKHNKIKDRIFIAFLTISCLAILFLILFGHTISSNSHSSCTNVYSSGLQTTKENAGTPIALYLGENFIVNNIEESDEHNVKTYHVSYTTKNNQTNELHVDSVGNVYDC